jgi:amidase
MRVGVKDLFDVAGTRTGAGNPDWLRTHPPAVRHAPVVQRLLDAGAALVGKTLTDELAYSLSGTNVHFGTPRNPRCADRVAGGSSAGSAAAVAGDLCDVGLATDTGGSIRVPASYCGVVGVRTTHAAVPTDGVVPLAPSFDTVGWHTADVEATRRVGEVLLPDGPQLPVTTIVVATDAFAAAQPATTVALRRALAAVADVASVVEEPWHADPGSLDRWAGAYLTLSRVEIWRVHGPWISAVGPRFGPGVAARFRAAAATSPALAAVAEPIRADVRRAVLRATRAGAAVVCLPAAAGPAPRRDAGEAEKDRLRADNLRLTAVAGLAGAPVVVVPAAAVDGCPVGLALLGAPGTDRALIATAAIVADRLASTAETPPPSSERRRARDRVADRDRIPRTVAGHGAHAHRPDRAGRRRPPA